MGCRIANPLPVLAVEGYRSDVTLVMLPLIQADWYVRQLREQHPSVVLPMTSSAQQLRTMRTLVEANRGRPIAVLGNVPDQSLKGSYWFYQHGLVSLLEPMSKDIKLSEMVTDNEELLGRYKIPSTSVIKPKSFEGNILTRYARPALRVGEEYEKGHLYAEARTWYQRALAIDPDLKLASEALTRITQAQ